MTTSPTFHRSSFCSILRLYDNILIGKPNASREDVLVAAEKAQCGEFLERLPNGIDTMAGDGGK